MSFWRIQPGEEQQALNPPESQAGHKLSLFNLDCSWFPEPQLKWFFYLLSSNGQSEWNNVRSNTWLDLLSHLGTNHCVLPLCRDSLVWGPFPLGLRPRGASHMVENHWSWYKEVTNVCSVLSGVLVSVSCWCVWMCGSLTRPRWRRRSPAAGPPFDYLLNIGVISKEELVCAIACICVHYVNNHYCSFANIVQCRIDAVI